MCECTQCIEKHYIYVHSDSDGNALTLYFGLRLSLATRRNIGNIGMPAKFIRFCRNMRRRRQKAAGLNGRGSLGGGVDQGDERTRDEKPKNECWTAASAPRYIRLQTTEASKCTALRCHRDTFERYPFGLLAACSRTRAGSWTGYKNFYSLISRNINEYIDASSCPCPNGYWMRGRERVNSEHSFASFSGSFDVLAKRN